MRVLLDENLPHDLNAVPFGVVVIAAQSSRVQDLLPLVPQFSPRSAPLPLARCFALAPDLVHSPAALTSLAENYAGVPLA